MKRAFVIAALAYCALAQAATADTLNGEQIRANLSGSKIVGVNDIGTPYALSLQRGGGLKGLMGAKNQFDDHGRWWVKDDKLCVQWELWLFAKPTCYGIELDGDQITRFQVDTRDVIRSKLVRGGKS
jgi:hypothetical protein